MATSQRELHSVQHGFAVKEPAEMFSSWAQPKLPPLHQHRQKDHSLAPVDAFLTRTDSGSQHPATPQQLQALRPLAASHTHEARHRAHHNHRHEKRDNTLPDDDSFGDYLCSMLDTSFLVYCHSSIHLMTCQTKTVSSGLDDVPCAIHHCHMSMN